MEVWQQALVENAKTFELGGETLSRQADSEAWVCGSWTSFR